MKTYVSLNICSGLRFFEVLSRIDVNDAELKVALETYREDNSWGSDVINLTGLKMILRLNVNIPHRGDESKHLQKIYRIITGHEYEVP